MLLKSTQARARKCNIDHSITLDDIVKVDICPYTKIPINWEDRSDKLYGPSIDRIDSTKGYIPGNVEVISLLANMMKSNASFEILVSFSEEVLRRYKNNNVY